MNSFIYLLASSDPFCYFLEHATSDTDAIIGIINFIVVFIILPTFVATVVGVIAIRLLLSLYEHLTGQNRTIQDKTHDKLK